MKNILIHIATWIAAFWVTAFMCASCGADHYTMRDDTFTVVEESKYHPDSLSKYILEYKDNRMEGTGEPISELEVILHRDAFEVGDKVKLVKIEK
jgi:hypothetical protein